MKTKVQHKDEWQLLFGRFALSKLDLDLSGHGDPLNVFINCQDPLDFATVDLLYNDKLERWTLGKNSAGKLRPTHKIVCSFNVRDYQKLYDLVKAYEKVRPFYFYPGAACKEIIKTLKSIFDIS